MTGNYSLGKDHLTAELASAWLDEALTGADAEQVAQHSADCDRCREELREVRRLMTHTAPARRGWRVLRFALPAAAAAAAVLWMVVPATRDGAGPIRGSTGADGPNRVAVISPSAGPLEALPPAFAWHPTGEDILYTITVTDAAGSLVWTDTTRDTVATLPAATQLQREREYFWYVDARHPGGEIATSGVQQFETSP